jgi:hypothetical protein
VAGRIAHAAAPDLKSRVACCNLLLDAGLDATDAVAMDTADEHCSLIPSAHHSDFHLSIFAENASMTWRGKVIHVATP